MGLSESYVTDWKGIRWMRLSHARRAVSVRFDDPNLVLCVGLAAVLVLVARCGFGGLVIDRFGSLPRAARTPRAVAVYRYHAIFTDNPQPMLDAEATHRDHAIIEQVIAGLKDSALAHLPCPPLSLAH